MAARTGQPARCAWARTALSVAYHDAEWGVPVHDDRVLFEFLTNPGIVRNRLKIASAVTNAKAFLTVQREFGSFDAYVWRFVGGTPKINRPRSMSSVPARTADSDALSKELQRRGFRFVGSTICYAFMQAVGMVDDHVAGCFRAGFR